ncbi:MAG: CbtA family protein, partial [Acidimicrobiia bacterium]|nr:CbtA family protein [Acidimicrobiia bacterium]
TAAGDDAAGHDAAGHDDELFSRGVQTAGGVLASIIYGLVTGLIFGVAFAKLRHRLALRDDFGRSVALAATIFGAAVALPFLKYPANPPAVGDPDTVDFRTVAYLTLVAASCVTAYALWRAADVLRDRPLTHAGRRAAMAALSVVVYSALFLVWPDNPDPMPATMPADLLYRFRLQSIAGLALHWGVLGVTFGVLCVGVRRAAEPLSPSLPVSPSEPGSPTPAPDRAGRS